MKSPSIKIFPNGGNPRKMADRSRKLFPRHNEPFCPCFPVRENSPSRGTKSPLRLYAHNRTLLLSCRLRVTVKMAWFNKARLRVTIGGMTCHGDLPQWQVTRTHGSLAPADSCARNTERLATC